MIISTYRKTAKEIAHGQNKSLLQFMLLISLKIQQSSLCLNFDGVISFN